LAQARSKKRFIILLADGARYDVFGDLLARGALPHLEEIFCGGGTYAKATSVFPSTTGPAYMPFLTGCFPGTCNVPGIRWFDKERYSQKRISLKRFRSYVGFESLLMNHDMERHLPTLFDLFPKSYNIFSTVNRGVSFKGNQTSHFRLWYWYYAHLTDRWHMVDEAALEKSLRVLKEDFEFLFVVFPGIDEYTHLSHHDHPMAQQAYRYIDQAAEKIVGQLKKDGKWDETAFFIVSDHGLSPTREHFGVASHLEEQGHKTFYYPKIFKRNFRVASMVSGNGMLHLYFKTNGTWVGRNSVGEIQEAFPGVFESLLEQPAIGVLASQNSDGWVHVHSRQGEARLRENAGKFYYECLRGDALGYGAVPREMDGRAALELTESSEYPDGIVQLAQLFRSTRTGDLVLSAAKGFDLRKRFEYPEHKSSHGALHDEHMLTPLFSSVPMQRSVVRSADLFPSILKLAGKPIPAGIDGSSFF
jgi:type I phosphodiesterase/nucleotide pyrophosphatase